MTFSRHSERADRTGESSNRTKAPVAPDRGNDAVDRPVPAVLTGRRSAIRSFAAAVAAVVATGSLTHSDAVASQNEEGDDVESERRGKRGRRGRRGRKGSKGRAGPSGPVESVLEQGDVATLPVQGAAGSTVTSVAVCDASSVLLGCGYELSTEAPEDLRALNNTIADVVPDVSARTCTATLMRTDFSNGQVQVAPQVRAYAICRA